jgi:hypothetical protein
MSIKTFTANSVLTAADTNTYLANSGLVYVTSATVGTAVSSVTVTGAFNSTYDNYKIVMSGGTCSSTAVVNLTIGGSTTGYYGILLYATYLSATPLAAGTNNASSMLYVGGCGTAGQAITADFDLLNPYLAQYSRIVGAQYSDSTYYGTTQGEHRVATSYSSFSLAPGVGTMTGGTITVYGYRKA